MLTNECWLGYHDLCSHWTGACDCLCHVTEDEIDAFLAGV